MSQTRHDLRALRLQEIDLREKALVDEEGILEDKRAQAETRIVQTRTLPWVPLMNALDKDTEATSAAATSNSGASDSSPGIHSIAERRKTRARLARGASADVYDASDELHEIQLKRKQIGMDRKRLGVHTSVSSSSSGYDRRVVYEKSD
ncbi:MAG: hypothetical protein ACR2LN_01545 [Candidatus Levyibacteriota bacterium]